MIAALIALTGIFGLFLGKYGTIISLITWILGLLGVLPCISFWWVGVFLITFVIGFLLTALGAYKLNKED